MSYTVIFGAWYDSKKSSFNDSMCDWYFAYHCTAPIKETIHENGIQEIVVSANSFVRKVCGRFETHYAPENITIRIVDNEIVSVFNGEVEYLPETEYSSQFPELGKVFLDPINGSHAIAITNKYKPKTYFSCIKKTKQ